ncbi:hypothetical protein ACFYZE_24325 [Streptomyces sp. NPDC001796]|uniref:hypothetical protein n=1 Tax=Streptomyces sp. NPDC001796 TaxID=3364609 RepID=UPI0036798371
MTLPALRQVSWAAPAWKVPFRVMVAGWPGAAVTVAAPTGPKRMLLPCPSRDVKSDPCRVRAAVAWLTATVMLRVV